MPQSPTESANLSIFDLQMRTKHLIRSSVSNGKRDVNCQRPYTESGEAGSGADVCQLGDPESSLTNRNIIKGGF